MESVIRVEESKQEEDLQAGISAATGTKVTILFIPHAVTNISQLHHRSPCANLLSAILPQVSPNPSVINLFPFIHKIRLNPLRDSKKIEEEKDVNNYKKH